KPGIVKALVARANLEDALKGAALPPRALPVLTLGVQEGGKDLKPDKGQVLVRSRDVTLSLDVGGYEREDAGDVAAWRLNGGAEQPFAREGKSPLWSAALKLPADGKRTHEVEAEFRLRERPGSPARTGRLTVRYQPPAP